MGDATVEMTLQELFDWLQGDTPDETVESEKLAVIDDLLGAGSLPDEREGLQRIKFHLLADTPWPTAQKIEAALAILENGADTDRLGVRPGQLGDRMRANYNTPPELVARVLDHEIALHGRIVDQLENGVAPPDVIANSPQPRYTKAALYNGYGATLHDAAKGDEDMLRRADDELAKADALLEPGDPPEAVLQVLANRFYVWAALEDWTSCRARTADFDAALERLRAQNPGLAKHRQFRSLLTKALGVTVLGALYAGSTGEGWRRFRKIDGRSDRLPTPDAQTVDIFMAPLAFPVIGFVASALGHGDTMVQVVELPELHRSGLMDMLSEADTGWFTGYAALAEQKVEAFKAALDASVERLEHELRPLLERVDPKRPVLELAPSNLLAHLPIHLLRGDNDRPLLETHRVRYAAPNRSVSESTPAADSRPGHFLGIANPRADLRHAEAEVDDLAKLFGEPPVLRAKQATRQAVIDRINGVQTAIYLHFAGHARHQWSEDIDARLKLAKGEVLTETDIREHIRLPPGSLVVLSACESGLPDSFRMPFDYGSLARAFLSVGAAGVISALWPVDDRSTALLMRRFYELHLGGMDPAAALRGAQLWLRDLTETHRVAYITLRGGMRAFGLEGVGEVDAQKAADDDRPYAHPYFWAGFTYTTR